MTNPFTNVGTKFYICAALPASYDLVGYSALTYTQIRGMRSIGDLGEKYLTVESNNIGEIAHMKRVGKASNSIDIELIKITDAGQTMLKAAFASMNSYTYKVLAVDGSVFYFTAGCSTRINNPGDANSIADIKGVLDLDSELLEV